MPDYAWLNECNRGNTSPDAIKSRNLLVMRSIDLSTEWRNVDSKYFSDLQIICLEDRIK